MSTARRALTLLLTDLYLDTGLRESAAQAHAPSLHALELVLARASHRESVDWREFALRTVRAPPLDPIPVAALSRLASGAGPAAAQWWVASAVELQAAHDHVQLAQVLSLCDEEWATLTAGFNSVFGAGACRLEAGQGTEAYLRFEAPLQASGVDPERIAGGDVHDALPGGPQGHILRRLMTEVQMWLYEHPLNHARNARGEAPVSGLWFWGGGELPAGAQPVSLPALLGTDRFLRGLWRWAGAEAQDAPSTFESARKALEKSPYGCIAAVTLREQPGASSAERLVEIDRNWLRPALAALRGGSLAMLGVHVSDVLLTLRARDLWRIWRRPRPWLEGFA